MNKKLLSNQRFIILTGLSGSGKTSALKVLEDQGFYIIDNLPAVLLPSLFGLFKTSSKPNRGLVLGMDVRGKNFISDYPIFAKGSLEWQKEKKNYRPKK